MYLLLRGQVGTCAGPNKCGGTPSLTSNALLSINKDGKCLGPGYYQRNPYIRAFK